MDTHAIPMFSIPDLEAIRDGLSREMTRADRGEKTSLVFAKHAIVRRMDECTEMVRVLVIGGSNVSSSIVRSTAGEIEILESRSAPLPVLRDRDTFMSLIDEYVDDECGILCINFAYPMNPTVRSGRLDGVLLKGTKEHVFRGLVGEAVGETVESHLMRRFQRKVEVSCANDTVCLILAGLGRWNTPSIAGGVVGTGFNFGFFQGESTVVNLESGNFSAFTPTDTGRMIDSGSTNRGLQALEKEVSGAYLYRHYNIYAERNRFDRRELLSTGDLASVAAGGGDGALCARNLFERSASLVAALIAGIYRFKESGNANVIIEGSLYWKGWEYRLHVDRYLQALGIPEDAILIHGIDESSILGGARLWL
jgi:hexokinase